MDKGTVIRKFEDIERRIEYLIKHCRQLEADNADLKSENQRLELALKDKESAGRQHDELKDLVRTKIESLMGRLDKLSEEQA